MGQQETPFLDALQQQANRQQTPFYFPGHKQGQGISSQLQNWLGLDVFKADLPELPELDNLFAPEQSLKEAQTLAAQAFQASQTWFLTNGSTAGIITSILSTCAPGDKILLPRNVHQCAIWGVVLSGATPVFIQPGYDADWDMPLSVSPQALEAALNQDSKIKAVLVVSPTYHGICSDLQAIATICHRRNIPLIVDEAHGSHFAFHPQFPPSALSAGADLVVQSTHKTLTAFSQAAMLHRQGDRVSGDRISAAFSLVQSTSPNSLLLASLDAARQQMATEGRERLQSLLTIVQKLRSQLATIPNLEVCPHTDDPTRLTVRLAGWTGYAADEYLDSHWDVLCELPQLQHLTFAFTLGNTPEDGDRLVASLTHLAQISPQSPHFPQIAPPPLPPLAITPRDAFFAAKKPVSLAESLHCICGDAVCPYPPGIPLLLPGERVTAEALAYLERVLAEGGTVTGWANGQEGTISVLKDS